MKMVIRIDSVREIVELAHLLESIFIAPEGAILDHAMNDLHESEINLDHALNPDAAIPQHE